MFSGNSKNNVSFFLLTIVIVYFFQTGLWMLWLQRTIKKWVWRRFYFWIQSLGCGTDTRFRHILPWSLSWIKACIRCQRVLADVLSGVMGWHLLGCSAPYETRSSVPLTFNWFAGTSGRNMSFPNMLSNTLWCARMGTHCFRRTVS